MKKHAATSNVAGTCMIIIAIHTLLRSHNLQREAGAKRNVANKAAPLTARTHRDKQDRQQVSVSRQPTEMQRNPINGSKATITSQAALLFVAVQIM